MRPAAALLSQGVAHRYRLYPTAEQERVCERHAADARYVWNLALEQLNHWRAGGPPSPGSAERFRQLAEARKGTWLGQGSSSVQQQALRDFERALSNWWSSTHGRPTWRKRGRSESFCVRDVTVRALNRKWAALTVPKVGRVKFRLSRPLPAEVGMARVTRDRKGRWHVSFTAPQPAIERETTGAVVGIDRGAATTLATSDGQMLRAPVMRKREQRRLASLQRQLARQRKGSGRRRRTRARIAALHQTVADRRRNWVEVQSTRLVRDYDLICVEKLNVKGMVRRPAPKPDPERAGAFLSNGAAAKGGLNHSLHAQAWSLWLRRLADKAEASGVAVVAVDPRHTSQQCRVCGHTAAENRESQAAFRCRRCGHTQHADRHAAENVLARGLSALAPTPGSGAERRRGASHRPGAARASRRRGAARTPVGAAA